MYRTLILGLFVTVLAAADPAGFRPDRYIGYWHDGSGVVRDATPVTTWRDFVYKEVTVKGKRGKAKPVMRADRSTGGQSQNIVWQVPHYNYCNGGMILVGGKLFALSDRGGLGFNIDRPCDFTGALMTCFDPATGKELWKVDLHHWDKVPNGQELVQVLKDYNAKFPAIYGSYSRLTQALGGAHGEGGNTTQAAYEPLRDAFNAAADKPAPDTIEAAKKSDLKIRGYIQTTFHGTVAPKYFPSAHQVRERLMREGGYLMDPWFGQMSHLGFNMQTPVSDGTHVYVATAFGAVFCVDLDGKVVWKHWFGAGWDRGWAIPSPVLVGDKLIVCGIKAGGKKGGEPQRVAMDTTSGKVLWSTGEISSTHYQPAPAVFSLPVGGKDADRMDVLLYGDGDVVRVDDGKRIATGIGGGGHARPWAVEGTLVGLVNGVQDGGRFKGKTRFDDHLKQLIVIELGAPSRDEVSTRLLWSEKECDGYSEGIIMKDGLLYWLDEKSKKFTVHDARTGKVIASTAGKRAPAGWQTRAFHLPIIAGRHYLALDQDGACQVIDLGADGRSPQAVACNLLSPPDRPGLGGRFNYGANPLASGNRLFIRSNEVLYCIGDPNAKMVLSAVHR